MVKGISYYLKQAWKKPGREMMQSRLIAWRASDAIEKVEKPTRLDRARALGYKAKRGVLVVRVRLNRGGRKRSTQHKGRKTRKQTIRKVLKMNYKWVAESRASKKYENLEVLNSYWVGRDGKHYYYEVILVDPKAPEIKSDRTLSWLSKGTHKERALRGLTSAAKKSRGLRSKSPIRKSRPSQRANSRKGK